MLEITLGSESAKQNAKCFKFEVLYEDVFNTHNAYTLALLASSRKEAFIEVINAHTSKKKRWNLLGIHLIEEEL